MLKRPAWTIMAERIGAFFSSLRKDWAYVGSMAGVLLMGIGAIQLALPQKQVVVVENRAASESVIIKPNDGIADLTSERFELAPGVPRKPVGDLHEARTLRRGPTRFVIDAQPASYEQTQIQF